MYSISKKRPKKFDYDLIVIGTGAGGGVVAHQAAVAGKRVAVVEMEKLGGECPNYGCIPTKALLQSAETYQSALQSAQFGINTSARVDYPAVKAYKDKAVKRTGTSEGEDLYDAEGIDVIHGHAHFLNPWVIAINNQKASAKNFVIATGTKSVVPPIPGLADSGYMTYRQAIDLVKPPKSLFVIGGGAIGCEFSERFSSFGTQVTIADMAPRLIAGEDPEVGELIEKLFIQKGIRVYTSAQITRIESSNTSKKIYFQIGKKNHSIQAEAILLSSGKVPNTDLGLENAGVKYSKTGIHVDRTMRTSARHIYATGDVVGPYRFTHMASYQSRIAANNLLHKKKIYASYRAVPRCVYTSPEVAAVGKTESQLKQESKHYKTAIVPTFVIGRANTSNQEAGFVKIITNNYGKLLGASIVAPRAGEMIHELALAIKQGMYAEDVASTIHAFPTWSEAVRIACAKLKI
jgi:mercuric reductase